MVLHLGCSIETLIKPSSPTQILATVRHSWPITIAHAPWWLANNHTLSAMYLPGMLRQTMYRELRSSLFICVRIQWHFLLLVHHTWKDPRLLLLANGLWSNYFEEEALHVLEMSRGYILQELFRSLRLKQYWKSEVLSYRLRLYTVYRRLYP